MLASSSDPEMRGEVMSLMGTAAFPIAAMSGINQHKNMYAFFLSNRSVQACPRHLTATGSIPADSRLICRA
jgi:hypothetical protein